MAVRWRDMDLNRHVNNVEYFRYLEQARIEWFDLAVKPWRDGTHGIVIANAHCNFLAPLTYPATIEVRDAAMASMTPVPAPPPGEPLDSAKARVQSSTVDRWVVTASESAITPSLLYG